MSFFEGPIQNVKPLIHIPVEEVYQLVTNNEAIRRQTEELQSHPMESPEFATLKKRLSYVTPAGIFAPTRSIKNLKEASGLLVVDIDKLSSPEEAAHWRDTLFQDRMLGTVLSFVSPSRLGVKLFIPYRSSAHADPVAQYDTAMQGVWQYLQLMYGIEADPSGRDIARPCYTCHDAFAKLQL